MEKSDILYRLTQAVIDMDATRAAAAAAAVIQHNVDPMRQLLKVSQREWIRSTNSLKTKNILCQKYFCSRCHECGN